MCLADIFTEGEGISSKFSRPPIRYGTSFAALRVTAAISNFLSHDLQPFDVIVKYLKETASSLMCSCIKLNHNQTIVFKKLDVQSFMCKVGEPIPMDICVESSTTMKRKTTDVALDKNDFSPPKCPKTMN